MSDPSNVQRPSVDDRPLSPHLMNYRLPLLPITSILGRVTGVGLAVGTLIVTWWLVALASGEAAYAQLSAIIGSPFGMLVMFGFTVSLFYHMCKGVRQFIWDSGQGLDVESAERMSFAVFGAAFVLSIATWAFILFV